MTKKKVFSKSDIDWKMVCSDLSKINSSLSNFAVKQRRDKMKALQILYRWSKQKRFREGSKTFLNQFNRLVKILQS